MASWLMAEKSLLLASGPKSDPFGIRFQSTGPNLRRYLTYQQTWLNEFSGFDDGSERFFMSHFRTNLHCRVTCGGISRWQTSSVASQNDITPKKAMRSGDRNRIPELVQRLWRPSKQPQKSIPAGRFPATTSALLTNISVIGTSAS